MNDSTNMIQNTYFKLQSHFKANKRILFVTRQKNAKVILKQTKMQDLCHCKTPCTNKNHVEMRHQISPIDLYSTKLSYLATKLEFFIKGSNTKYQLVTRQYDDLCHFVCTYIDRR